MHFAMIDAQTDSQAHRDYLESRILTAPPVEIVHWLYQVATDNLTTAIACLRTGDNFGRGRAVTKAQEAIDELMFALDHKVGASFTRNLAELYDFAQREIITGHTRRSEKAFRNALGVLTTLSEGWAGVRERLMADHSPAPVEAAESDTRQEQTQGDGLSHLYSQVLPGPDPARDWSC